MQETRNGLLPKQREEYLKEGKAMEMTIELAHSVVSAIIPPQATGEERKVAIDKLAYNIVQLMRDSVLMQRTYLLGTLREMYPAMSEEKYNKLNHSPWPYGLEVLDKPESLKNPEEVLEDLLSDDTVRKNPRMLVQALKDRGIVLKSLNLGN